MAVREVWQSAAWVQAIDISINRFPNIVLLLQETMTLFDRSHSQQQQKAVLAGSFEQRIRKPALQL